MKLSNYSMGERNMNEVTRYDLEQYEGEWATMREDELGDYVLASDYDQLKAKLNDPVKQMLLEALEKVDSEHEILGWMKTCELRRGRGSFGIAVMSDELALDWQVHQKNLERLIGLRHAAIAAARKGEGE